MKKALLPVFLAAFLMACGNSSKTEVSALAGDSTQVDEENEQSEDHYAIWQMDSTNEMNFTTYDLAAMEVRGHVKRIVWNSGGWVARFSEEGELTFLTDDTSEYMLGHDEDGFLTSYAVGAGSVVYIIDPKTNLLSCYSGGEGSASWENWYKYDKEGNLTEIEYNNEDVAEETKETTREKVTVLEVDSHNNWTKRKIGNSVTTRTIIYYPNAIDLGDEPDAEGEDFRPFSNKYSFVGTIGKDENCTLTFEGGQGTYTVGVGQRYMDVDRYEPTTGELVLMAFMKSSGEMIGKFKGTYKDGVYKGVFENNNGGKVNFCLTKQ